MRGWQLHQFTEFDFQTANAAEASQAETWMSPMAQQDTAMQGQVDEVLSTAKHLNQ